MSYLSSNANFNGPYPKIGLWKLFLLECITLVRDIIIFVYSAAFTVKAKHLHLSSGCQISGSECKF